MKKTGLALLMILVALLAACAAGRAPVSIGQEWLSAPSNAVSVTYDIPKLVSFKGIVRQVYFGPDNNVMVRNAESGKESLVFQAPRGVQLSTLSVYSDSQKMYVAWRPKLFSNVEGLGATGDKMIFVTNSLDGERFSAPNRVSGSNGAFAPIITGNGAGSVYVVWQDERNGSGLDLYFNYSSDFGANWKPDDTRLDFNARGETFSAEPSLVAEGKNVWLVWTESPQGKHAQNSFPVSVRMSSNEGETWGEPVTVGKPERPALYPQLLQVGNKLFVYWFSEQGIGGAWSSDQGSNWTGIKPVAAEVKARSLVARVDSVGGVHLVYGHMGGSDKFNNLYYVYAANGVDFSEPYALNAEDGGFTYSAALATMAFDHLNNVMVAWIDYRYFRPVVMGKHSADQGKSWSPGYLMSRGPDDSNSEFPQLLANGDSWWASMVQYPKGIALSAGQARLARVSLDSSRRAPALTADVVAQLKERSTKWWQTRLKGDWSASYDSLDPMMRDRITRAAYVASQGSTKYYEFEIVQTELVSERRANVRVKFTFEVPELVMGDKKLSVPKKEATVEQEWIYVDGNWFVLFKDVYGKSFAE